MRRTDYHLWPARGDRREWPRLGWWHRKVVFWPFAVACVIAFLLWGCSTLPTETQAHEERHCNGETHTGTAPFYEWHQARAASAKPWFYVYVDDIDTTCRLLGSVAQGTINGCSIWKPQGCEIYLPKD